MIQLLGEKGKRISYMKKILRKENKSNKNQENQV